MIVPSLRIPARRSVLCSIVSTMVAYASSGGQTPKASPIQNVAAGDQLSMRLQQCKPLKVEADIASSPSEAPAVESPRQDLLSLSDIICFGDAVTLVPKGAVLFIPKNYAARLKPQPGAVFVTWKEFYPANKSWIITTEVTSDQIEGIEPLTEQVKSQHAKGGKLVVATYQGNPTSIILKPNSITSIPPSKP